MSSGKKVLFREISWITATLMVVFLFLFPIALQWHGIFIDDLSTFNYPNAVFQSRSLKNGIIPLWNPHIFAGALPFYTTFDAFAFYLPQWAVALISDSIPSGRAYQQLVLWPVLGHYLWAALGAFIMGRWGLRLSRPGSSVLALVFALGSSMLAGMVNPPMAVALSWHPWLVAAVLLYANRRRTMWLVVGGIIIALTAPAWPNYTLHGLILAFLFGAVSIIRGGSAAGKRAAVGLTLGLLIMAALGFLLAVPFWWSLAEAAQSAKATFDVTYEFLSAGPRSVPLRYFATLFVPELFGSTNFAFIWGVTEEAKMYWCEATLPKGMLLWLPAFLAAWAGFLSIIRRRRRISDKPFLGSTAHRSPLSAHCDSLLPWTWLSTGLVLFSFLLLLGRHTPVFGLLYRLCPLFKISYASRWHTTFTMGFSVLTGIGVTCLLESPPGKILATRRRIIAYLALVTLLAGAALVLPLGYWRKLADVGWFLHVPVLYWIVCTLVLIAVCFIRPPVRAGKIIVLLSLLGLFRSAWWDAYRPMGVTWAPEQESLKGPSESSLYRFGKFAAEFNKDDNRRTGYSSVFADNSALLQGGYSLLGVCVKPMLPRMYHVLHSLCDGWPYELYLHDPAMPFTANMSTAFWWYDSSRSPSDDWNYVTSSPDSRLFLFRNPKALPRVFVQDVLIEAGEEYQRSRLVEGDLRQGVFAEPDMMENLNSPPPPRVVTRQEFFRDGGNSPESFLSLQEQNRIISADFSHPNRIDVEIEVSKPVMLVLTDVWHPAWRALDNGEPVTIHRVNYLQRGIWLGEGNHEVKMEFYPPAVFTGRWISLIGIIFGAVLLVGGRFKHKITPH